MPNASLIATLADLKAQRAYVQLRYDNSPWSMGPAYREQLEKLDRQIAELKDAADA